MQNVSLNHCAITIVEKLYSYIKLNKQIPSDSQFVAAFFYQLCVPKPISRYYVIFVTHQISLFEQNNFV